MHPIKYAPTVLLSNVAGLVITHNKRIKADERVDLVR